MDTHPETRGRNKASGAAPRTSAAFGEGLKALTLLFVILLMALPTAPAFAKRAAPEARAERKLSCRSAAERDGLRVELEEISNWVQGASYEMRLRNTGEAPITHTRVQLALPGAQSVDLWGVEGEIALPQVALALPAWASPMAPGQVQTFAFNVYPGTQACGLRILEVWEAGEPTPSPTAAPTPTPWPQTPTPTEIFDMEDPFDGELVDPSPVPSDGFAPPLSTKGRHILNAGGGRVTLRGVNWFGMETETYTPHGLWERSWQSMMEQVAAEGFNTLRLPFGQDFLSPGRAPTSINYDLNKDLKGLSALQVLDKIVDRAGELGIYVILDRHTLWANHRSELWYSGSRTASASANPYGEEAWIQGLESLARRYKDKPQVVGMDLHNEPHGRASWGTGVLDTDWRLAAERAGNRVLKANPDLLILVEGVETNVVGAEGVYYWWGGNLMGVKDYPVRLSRGDRTVYSPHAYGAGVYGQSWFYAADYPNNLEGIWRSHWGYIAETNLAPILLGEFGGWSADPSATAPGSTEWREAVWQTEVVDYQMREGLSGTYWSLNPNSGDTGGYLEDDWWNVVPEKRALLSPWFSSSEFALSGS